MIDKAPEFAIPEPQLLVVDEPIRETVKELQDSADDFDEKRSPQIETENVDEDLKLEVKVSMTNPQELPELKASTQNLFDQF